MPDARLLLLAAMMLLLAACAGPQGSHASRGEGADARAASTSVGASAPLPATRKGGGYYLDDGPGENAPTDLAAIPDAVPRAEALNPATLRPYSVFGRQYTPMTRLEPYRARGMASWYGRRYHGQPTSSGERYDMYAMTAAHPTLPIPSYVRVTRPDDGRSVIVRVNDRGPFLQNRLIDLSYTAAAKLGYVAAGSAEVEVELITQFDNAAPLVALPARPPTLAAPAGAAVELAPKVEPALVAATAPPLTSAAPPSPPLSTSPPGTASPPSGTASPPPMRLTLETVQLDPPAPPAEVRPPAATFWLQLGAFASLDGARGALARFTRQLDWLAAGFDIRREGALFKVQAGPWPQREQALAAAERIRVRTELKPFATRR